MFRRVLSIFNRCKDTWAGFSVAIFWSNCRCWSSWTVNIINNCSIRIIAVSDLCLCPCSTWCTACSTVSPTTPSYNHSSLPYWTMPNWNVYLIPGQSSSTQTAVSSALPSPQSEALSVSKLLWSLQVRVLVRVPLPHDTEQGPSLQTVHTKKWSIYMPEIALKKNPLPGQFWVLQLTTFEASAVPPGQSSDEVGPSVWSLQSLVLSWLPIPQVKVQVPSIQVAQACVKKWNLFWKLAQIVKM